MALRALRRGEARQKTLPVLESPDLYKVVVVGTIRAKDMLMPTRATPHTERVTNA